ncbi:DNA ligase (NAD(+)) LigA [Sphingobacteriales bacterium UPWRP_1]|nr:DNA ligase (NAD(+)) LigA [Sphingobacteriales bacterium TSM_CSS]PSJ73835.1 DNA ligase (NAD(+)) LigA [Sphingobacteriales bacterium UPWRP_1]
MYTAQESRQIEQQTARLLQTKRSQLHNLNPMQTALLAEELRTVINYYDWQYYVQATQVIPDVDYDYLFDLLKTIEQQHPELQTPESPTQRVARGLSTEFATVTHLVPMLSLDKAYSEADLLNWDTAVKKLTEREQVEYSVEPKFDGSSIAMVYENDLLVRGATRGNGTDGEDITNNLKTIPTIPLKAAFATKGIYRAEVRGEVVIDKLKFEQINQMRAKKGEALLSNPRNSAAGGLRLKDASKVGERKLEAFVFQLGIAFDANGNDITIPLLQKHTNGMSIMYDLGFKTPLKTRDESVHICANIEEVIAYCNHWKEHRKDFPYEIDGLVVKVNDLQLQDRCGATSHHPRWAIAYKFDARQAITIVERVEFQVGRTGAITPVAKLQTVNLSGANISNASLHNQDFISEKDIRIGDKVVLERAGDVIPYIVEVVIDERTGAEQPVVFPENCPSCGSRLVKPDGESVWRCINADCPAQVEERIIHYASKDAMDIRGLGVEIIRRFFQLGWLRTIEDIYRLNYEEIARLDGWGQKSADNLKASIEASKNRPLQQLIIGLGIRDVGNATAQTLAKAVTSVFDLPNYTLEQLTQLPDIGPKVAENIVGFFAEPQNLQLITALQQLGVNTQKTEADMPAEGGIFSGKTFLFTGSLQRLKRNEAEKIVEKNGGSILSSVSKNLNYLIVGAEPGSKLDKARKIAAIQILTEEEFFELLQNNG